MKVVVPIVFCAIFSSFDALLTILALKMGATETNWLIAQLINCGNSIFILAKLCFPIILLSVANKFNEKAAFKCALFGIFIYGVVSIYTLINLINLYGQQIHSSI